ncbi:MAG TPA: MmcQ/YjbR family DNA-binding protein [Pseudonocardiaceae bacterium]
MLDDDEVPSWILDGLRPICAQLPQAYEEPAWVGIRWRIRKRTFAHVRTLRPDQLAELGRVAEPDGVTTVDWSEIRELLTESYRILAPKGLVHVLGRRG